MEFTLLAAAATGVGAMWLAARLFGDAITVDRPGDHLVGAAVVGLFVGRVASMIHAGVNPFTSPGDIIVIRGGVDTAWASIGAVVALVWTTRDRLPTAIDQLAPLALVGLAGWHGGCLWRDACLGTPTSLPWGWAADGSTVSRHPVELYVAVGLVVAALALRGIRTPWAPAGLGLAAAGLVRLVTQPLRVSVTGGPVWWYAAAAALGVAIAVAGRSLPTTHDHDAVRG